MATSCANYEHYRLVTAITPSSCSYYEDPVKDYLCSPSKVTRYQKRISGPLLERTDIHIEAHGAVYGKLSPRLYFRTALHPARTNPHPGAGSTPNAFQSASTTAASPGIPAKTSNTAFRTQGGASSAKTSASELRRA